MDRASQGPPALAKRLRRRASGTHDTAQAFVLVSSRLACALLLAGLAAAAPAAETLGRTNGERLEGRVLYDKGAWQIGSRDIPAAEVLWVSFFASGPPEKLPAGVSVRGGSLLAGTLDALIGDAAVVNAASLGPGFRLKGEDLAGAFFPLPLGETENLPALNRYARVFAALEMAGLHGTEPASDDEARLQPGRRDRATYTNLDSVGGRLIRLGPDKAMLSLPAGDLFTPKRSLLRALELKTPSPPEPPPEELRLGPEWLVRLRSGDVLRGRLNALDRRELRLATSWGGTLRLPRELLAALYPLGGPGGTVTWLAGLKPARSAHTPLFDAPFPLRRNLSCDGRFMLLNGMACDRGLGVHSRAEVAYALAKGEQKRLVAWVGLDDETKGRGAAEAKVLLDGREAWFSGPLLPRSAPKSVAVDLGAAREVLLLVEYGPDGDDSGDHVDWGWAALVR